MNEKIFQFSEYTDFLKSLIESTKNIRGYQAKLAAAANSHTSYFSRVLSGAVQLTPDQAANLAQYLGMTPDQTDYFISLVSFARAGSLALKKVIERQLFDLKKKSQEISQRFSSSKDLSGSEAGIYYSAWYYSAIHMLLMIPGQQSESVLAKRLGISEGMAQKALEVLLSLKIIEKKGSRWLVKETDLHVPNQYFWTPVYHANWRQRAAYRVFEQRDEDIHFTALHSMSRSDFELVKELLRETVQKIRGIAAPSKEEDVFSVGIDAFRV